VGRLPAGVDVTPDGRQLYVANTGSNSVSIIDIATNAIVDTVAVGDSPAAFGRFITTFAATPTNVVELTALSTVSLIVLIMLLTFLALCVHRSHLHSRKNA
jgi:YVTN family beta-propeller protein